MTEASGHVLGIQVYFSSKQILLCRGQQYTNYIYFVADTALFLSDKSSHGAISVEKRSSLSDKELKPYASSTSAEAFKLVSSHILHYICPTRGTSVF